MHSKNKSASDLRKPSTKPRRRTAPPPGWSTTDPAWSPKPKSSSYPSTPTSKQPWNNPNRRTPDQVQKAKDLEQLQEAALVSHKCKQEDVERLRIMSQNQKEREEIAQRNREHEAKEQPSTSTQWPTYSARSTRVWKNIG